LVRAVRILDFAGKNDGVFQGYGSIAEMAKAKPKWGPGFAEATLATGNAVVEYGGRYLKLLTFGDGTSSFGVPVAMGPRWLRSSGSGDKVFGMVRSVWRFVKSQNPVMFPPPPQPSVPTVTQDAILLSPVYLKS